MTRPRLARATDIRLPTYLERCRRWGPKKGAALLQLFVNRVDRLVFDGVTT